MSHPADADFEVAVVSLAVQLCCLLVELATLLLLADWKQRDLASKERGQ